MNSLERRVAKLEELRTPNPEALRKAESLRTAVEKARARVLAVDPEHEFSTTPLHDGPFDLVASLDAGRQRAKERIERLQNS